MRYGAIYVAHNPRDGDHVFKVGKTERSVDERMKELTAATSNLGTYTACAYFVVYDMDAAEEACHRRLSRYRVQDNREFFEIPLSRLLKIVKEQVELCAAQDFLPKIEESEPEVARTVSAAEMLKSVRDAEHNVTGLGRNNWQ